MASGLLVSSIATEVCVLTSLGMYLGYVSCHQLLITSKFCVFKTLYTRDVTG